MNNYSQLAIPDSLKSTERFKDYESLDLWLYQTGTNKKYNCYIFILELPSEIELQEVWENLRNNIAANFQSKLKNEIEVWNIYLLFLIKKNVSRSVKHRIEQDKYSSRKIVVDNYKINYSDFDLHNQQSVMNLLDDCLFNIQLENKTSIRKKESSLKSLIAKKDPKALEVLAKYTPGINKKKQIYHQYLQKYNIQ